MKLVERKNNELIETGTITNIENLDNSVLVLIERGDKIRKAIKGGRTMFGNRNLFSVRSMKEAMDINANKEAKKNKADGHFCCVCSEWAKSSELDERGVCRHCQLS